MGNEKRIRATVAIVKAYLEANPLPEWELAALIKSVGDSLLVLEASHEEEVAPPARQTPVFIPGRSVALRHQRKTRFSAVTVTRH